MRSRARLRRTATNCMYYLYQCKYTHTHTHIYYVPYRCSAQLSIAINSSILIRIYMRILRVCFWFS